MYKRQNKDDSVVVIDDLIATGGTAEAAAKLIKISNGKVAGFVFVINLFDLGGCDKLIKQGYKVENLDAKGYFVEELKKLKPKIVFNALHGKYGEDGCVQGVLEVMQIPYTHSGVLASALAMQKPMAKTLFKSIGIPCAQHVIADRDTVLSDSLMEKPYVLKPLNQGSSIGIQIIEEDSQLSALIQKEWPYGENVMVEKYIPGREITVAVMGSRALAVTELITKNKFYNYEAKYTNGRATHIIPALSLIHI